jgi:antitoxin component of MazEF toxin-antitoxin module
MTGYFQRVQKMPAVIVGRWDRNLAIRVPAEVARATGLSAGEQFEVKMQDRDIIVHRRAAQAGARNEAEEAAREIAEESRRYSLGTLSIRELLDEGRRE